jgi:hypothetical protein
LAAVTKSEKEMLGVLGKIESSQPPGKPVEQGSSYNRRNRESEERRDGGGQARSSAEAG